MNCNNAVTYVHYIILTLTFIHFIRRLLVRPDDVDAKSGFFKTHSMNKTELLIALIAIIFILTAIALFI